MSIEKLRRSGKWGANNFGMQWVSFSEGTHFTSCFVSCEQTRECQVKMSNIVLMHIPDEMVNAIREFDDDYLADVLRPWDCYKQDWYDNFTTLYRFESNDYLVYEDKEGINYKVAPIDTSSFDESLLKLIGTNESEACLCWRYDKKAKDFIGNAHVATKVLSQFLEQYQSSCNYSIRLLGS